MSSLVKVGLFAAGAYALYSLYRAAQTAFADFAYKIVGYGIPSIDSSYRVTLPVKIRFTNPTPLTIQLDNVLIDVYLLKPEGFVHVGQVSTPLTLAPGSSTHDIMPMIDLQSVFGGFAQTVRNALSAKALTLRTDVTVTYKGVTLPSQSSTDNVSLF